MVCRYWIRPLTSQSSIRSVGHLRRSWRLDPGFRGPSTTEGSWRPASAIGGRGKWCRRRPSAAAARRSLSAIPSSRAVSSPHTHTYVPCGLRSGGSKSHRGNCHRTLSVSCGTRCRHLRLRLGVVGVSSYLVGRCPGCRAHAHCEQDLEKARQLDHDG